ncbi:MAG: hypothetical protein JAZ17_19975 [Candidatus Thiodiazotropha endolucinida]|nr:hypothetical protein [Candidatus Thiodiazotropha endolucinida]
MTSFAPIVLLVDDDPSSGRSMRRKFNNLSALAPLVVQDLRSARKLIETWRYEISAVVADLSMPDAGDPEHNLEDGLDFLSLVQKSHPNVSKYVISFWSDQHSWRSKSNQLGLDIHEWFEKLNTLEPWAKVERDLLKTHLVHGGSLAEEVAAHGWMPHDEQSFEAILQWFRTRHKGMKFSFIQEVPKDYRDQYELIEPVQVVCREQDGEFIADAIKLGLLNEGHGEDVEEAVKDLADTMFALKEELDSYSPENVVDYAKVVKDRIDQYIRAIPLENFH